MRAAAAIALLALASACGGSSPKPSCTPGGDGSYVTTPFEKLSQYCLVEMKDGEILAKGEREGGLVTSYDLNTPLYSDGALKRRTVWVPKGKSGTYDANKAFEFPTGTVFTKSFGFRDDLRKSSPKVDWIETRLLIKTDAGWQGYAYLWNDARTEATLDYGGKVQAVSWLDEDGRTQQINYLVPSFNQCKQCHADAAGKMNLIGPTARNLNRGFGYWDGHEQQLPRWTRLGILTGAPADTAAPKLTAWDDKNANVADRARAYLEVNCAHCHSADGAARNSGLFLTSAETDAKKLGTCKPSVAAGEATGGRLYDIVPGKPDESILVYRLEATAPAVAMPQIGRGSADKPGVQLVREWITGLTGTCPN